MVKLQSIRGSMSGTDRTQWTLAKEMNETGTTIEHLDNSDEGLLVLVVGKGFEIVAEVTAIIIKRQWVETLNESSDNARHEIVTGYDILFRIPQSEMPVHLQRPLAVPGCHIG